MAPVVIPTAAAVRRSQDVREQSRIEHARAQVLRKAADEEIERSTLVREVLRFRGTWTRPDAALSRVLVPLGGSKL